MNGYVVISCTDSIISSSLLILHYADSSTVEKSSMWPWEQAHLLPSVWTQHSLQTCQGSCSRPQRIDARKERYSITAMSWGCSCAVLCLPHSIRGTEIIVLINRVVSRARCSGFRGRWRGNIWLLLPGTHGTLECNYTWCLAHISAEEISLSVFFAKFYVPSLGQQAKMNGKLRNWHTSSKTLGKQL